MEGHTCGRIAHRHSLVHLGPRVRSANSECTLFARYIFPSRTRLRLLTGQVRETGKFVVTCSLGSPSGAGVSQRAAGEAASPTDAVKVEGHEVSKKRFEAPSREHGFDKAAPAVLAGLLFPLLGCAAAFSDEGVAYQSGAGMDLLKLLAGVAYVILVVFFVVRLLKKRASNATSQRIARVADEEELAAIPPEPKTTPLRAAWGAVQAGVCAYFLWKLSAGVDGYFDGQELPSQYTARNITVSVRTITSGLSYLLAGIFTANTLGLTGLTLKLLISPDEVKSPKPPEDMPDSTSG